MKVQLGVRFLPGDHACTRARTHLSMHRWFIEQESTLFYCSNPLSLHHQSPLAASERLPCLSLLLSAIYQSIAFSLRYFNIEQISRGARDHTELISLPQAPIYRVCLSHSPKKNHPSFMLFARIELTRSTTDRKPSRTEASPRNKKIDNREKNFSARKRGRIYIYRGALHGCV